jgi:vacuolar-type H+-ATPase subunit F/Vma7
VGLFAVIGDAAQVNGFALAGARVLPAENPDEVVRAWESLSDDTVVVLLTNEAAAALGETRAQPAQWLSVVMPT